MRSLLGAACVAVPSQGSARDVGTNDGATQSTNLQARIARVSNGTVRLAFKAREGVCGNGMSWYRMRGPNTYSGTVINGNWSSMRDVEATCERGLVRVVVVRTNNETTELRYTVGGRWREDTTAVDLGQVGASEAGQWLLQVGSTGLAKPARTAMSAATVSDSVDATATLLRIAKDELRPSDVRNSALNWLGEVVGDKVTRTLDSIAYEPGDREVRKQAIATLSRRPADEAIPALLKMVETLPDRELRKTAVFWLAQSKDPRAMRWMEQQLSR
ncbi:MAG: HEAT repeat domain-containing protein [Gemmatimonadaceae bacterium]|nr:HEAT repeat domain-containing protein [Gemmatimonadaceae bacterium]